MRSLFQRFEYHLADKFRKKKDQKEKPFKNYAKVDESQIHLKALQFIKEENYRGRKPILDLTAIGYALDYFIKMGDVTNQMLCYENLLKYFIYGKDWIAVEIYSNLLFYLVAKLAKKQLEKFPGLSLLFSTLGVAYYKLSKMKRGCKLANLKRSCELLLNGVNLADNKRDKMVLLNNLACALSMIEGQQKEASEAFQEAYNLIENQNKSFYGEALYVWSRTKASDIGYTDFVRIKNGNSNRSFEYILLADKTFPKIWKNPLDQDPFNFSFVIFQNYCFDRARNMLLALLESDQDENLLKKLIETSFYFNCQNSAAIRLHFGLEILLNLLKLATIFEEITGDYKQNELFRKAKTESHDFLEKKEELIQYFQANKLDLLIEELSKSELLFLMFGLANTFRDSEEKNAKEIIMNIAKDIEFYFKKYEVSLKISERSFSLGRVFVRNFSQPISVPFKEINNSIRELAKEGKIDIPLIPDKLVEVYGLQSCGYKMIFVGDESYPKLVLNSLDLFYIPGFSSSLESLEYLNLEIQTEIDEDHMSEQTASSISQELIKLQKLKSLNLYFTLFANFREHSFRPFADALSSLSSLQELQIVFGWADECELTLQHFEKAIIHLEKLKSLYLVFGYHSTLTDESISSLAKTLCTLKNLQDITLLFFACGGISIKEAQKVHDMLLEKKKNPSIVIYPMRLSDWKLYRYF